MWGNSIQTNEGTLGHVLGSVDPLFPGDTSPQNSRQTSLKGSFTVMRRDDIFFHGYARLSAHIPSLGHSSTGCFRRTPVIESRLATTHHDLSLRFCFLCTLRIDNRG